VSNIRPIIGESQPVKEMLKLIDRVATTKTNVLIIGDSGTGKELVARMIHEKSPLKGKPFIPVNCGAIPENLIESELFGHKRGSFTGAVSDKPGLFEAANGGTIFLDEVGELPMSMQVKLLRVIQERNFRKVGGNDDIKVDLRIIAATNRDLEAAVAKGTFREDLYYRLNVILIKTPALKDRREDIPILATHFFKKFSVKQNKTLQGFDEEALKAICAYDWPGNIRELENVIERAVTLESADMVRKSSLPGIISGEEGSSPNTAEKSSSFLDLPAPDFSRGSVRLPDILSRVEKAYIDAAIKFTGNRVTAETARLLGVELKKIKGFR
jgi:two-component system response regulator PilR (NtrC family)